MHPRYEFLDHPGPIPFAHRGGAAEGPENTRASFSHALSLGYRYLETDVHATADGVVVIIHDPDLGRTADRPGRVGDLPWSAVGAARLPGDQRPLRLEEALEEWPDARWNIDAKHDAVVQPLAALLRRTGAVGRVCVTSFSDRRVAQLRRLLGPTLCSATGPAAITALRLASLSPLPGAARKVGRGTWGGAGATQVPVRQGRIPVADRRFVAFAHRVGLAVHVWTVDDEPTMDRLLNLGVDGIMTDRPTLLRSVLQRRGQWVAAA